MSSIYQNMINLVFSIEIRGSPSRLVDIKVLESGARDNHVLCGSEGYQSEAIVACFLVQTVLPSLPTFALKSPTRASVIRNFELVVKGILGCVILILRRRMGTYKANVKIVCLSADGD